jgi:hypothetical protein
MRLLRSMTEGKKTKGTRVISQARDGKVEEEKKNIFVRIWQKKTKTHSSLRTDIYQIARR